MKSEYTLTSSIRSGRPRRPIEIMMAPMIDVIFLLLVFFLATSSFRIPELLLPSGVSKMQPPTGQNAQIPPTPNEDRIEQVILKGAIEGGAAVWTLNNIRLSSIQQVRDRLLAISQLQRDLPVIIDPNGKIAIGDVVSAYDAAREVGLTRVFMAIHSKADARK